MVECKCDVRTNEFVRNKYSKGGKDKESHARLYQKIRRDSREFTESPASYGEQNANPQPRLK